MKDFERIAQVVEYLKARGKFDQSCKLYEIWEWMDDNEIINKLDKTKSRLLSTSYGSEEYAKIENVSL